MMYTEMHGFTGNGRWIKMSTLYITIALAITVNGYKMKYLSKNSGTDAPISISYAHDKKSDMVTRECIAEMYPSDLYKNPVIDKNDVPCIIHCVLKKFRIISPDGIINIRNYYRLVQAIHRYDPRILVSDVGEMCAQNINTMSLDHDLCKKAKVFNDCTQLYAVSLKEFN